MNEFIVSVAVPRAVDKTFIYVLPVDYVSQIQIGTCVEVPFGTSVLHAFVTEKPKNILELPATIARSRLKTVLRVYQNGITPEIFHLCQWASDYYSAPLGEVLKGAFPKALLQSYDTMPVQEVSMQWDCGSVQLTEAQTIALQEILEYQKKQAFGVVLLKGVTGSGKTEIYLELARSVLENGKGVLILVPEIALTPQLFERFQKRFKMPIAIWHSGISVKNRAQQNESLRQGLISLVIGARSAVFAPLKNLGLIVVDEEHDPTFKQDDRIRYHARDLAIVRAKQAGALVVLGSATPSFETLERVNQHKYIQVNLLQSMASYGLPSIELVHLFYEKKMPHSQSLLAEKTIRAIQATLDAKEQVMIYLNRRGFAAFLLCQECNFVFECPDCSISLTVYHQGEQLRCHCCGHVASIPLHCPQCSGVRLKEIGAGTEGLEQDLMHFLQGAKILRLDRDQITSVNRLNKVLNQFRKQEANILLGTQMLVKGHDFPEVTLVVVVLADALFCWPDFRAHERAYQVLKQVSGRSGRGKKPGRVLIQTFDVNHPVLQVLTGRLAEEEFLQKEMQWREDLDYPPFGRLVRVRFEGRSKKIVFTEAHELAEQIRAASMTSLQCLGPSEAFLEKAKGLFRLDFLLKARRLQSLQMAISMIKQSQQFKKCNVAIDVDPYSI